MNDTEKRELRQHFAKVVNMAPAKLEHWLQTEDSRKVGWPKDRGKTESVGHESGRHIIAIKHKRQADLTEGDYEHMKKVIGYVARHSKQRPDGDVSDTPWRFSLMNWGHDPLLGD